MQLDQKKVPIFHAEPDKDILNVREWAKRIEAMKSSQNWNEKATYDNATQSLFGNAALYMSSQCDIEVKEDFEETWKWLKKKMLIALVPGGAIRCERNTGCRSAFKTKWIARR